MSREVDPRILEIAEKYQKKYATTDQFKKYFIAQMIHETGNGTSELAMEYNNFGGITGYNDAAGPQPDGDQNYASFQTLDEYVEVVYKYVFRHYPEIHDAKSVEEYSWILKENGYYGAPYEEYTASLARIAGEEYTPGTIPAGAGSRTKTNGTAFDSSAASDTGVKADVEGKKGTPETYIIYRTQKLAKNKTYTQPIYPDLISVYNQVPEWALTVPADVDEAARVTGDKPSLDDVKPITAAPDMKKHYEVINYEDCFNVGLPLTAIAKYGTETAKYQIGKMRSIAERQIQFDPTKHDNAVKLPSAGMVPNHTDPFPVDLRIRDLELHRPRIVKEQIKATEFELNTAKATLEISGDAEKRVAQIENHLSTITRYLFRLANVVPINDVYYGGNTLYEKYKGLRQLTDDRISDGMTTQLDQYLTSTRIEPIIGQVYEILNQVGANLSIILDNNQLGYSDMKHYCDLIDIKRYQEPLKLADMKEGASLTRTTEDPDLSAKWPKGFTMDWKLTPVEEQSPMINWRQSLTDDGSSLMNSPSLFGSGNAAGAAMTGSPNNLFWITADEAESSSVFSKWVSEAKEKANSYIDQAKNIAKSKDTYTKMQGAVKDANLHNDFSTVIVATLMCIENTSSPDNIISGLKDATEKLRSSSSITNPLLVALAYFFGDQNVAGNKPTTDPTTEAQKHEELKTRLDFVYGLTGNSGGSDNSNQGISKKFFGLDIKNESGWRLSQFWEPYTINSTKKRELPIKEPANELRRLVELCVCYKELSKEFYATEFDNDKWGFFFKQEYIQDMKLTGWPGEVRDDHIHQGMDIVFLPDEPKIEIISICDGEVIDTGWGVNAVMVNSANGTNKTIVYMHMAQLFVSVGDKIKRGQPIGIIGGWGTRKKDGYVGNECYPEHLHIEVWTELNRGGSYISVGELYPGVFQDYVNTYLNQIKPAEYRFADFRN